MIRYGKPPLIEQLPPARGVVQASAGTGKTFTLERMVVDFLLAGTPLEQILVVTFTEKAALELRARIRQMLDTLAQLAATPEDTRDPVWTLGTRERTLLQAGLRSFDRATISTIHGFCRRILVEGAFEGGTLLRQELVDGRKLFLQAFRDCVRLRFPGTPGGEELLLEALQAMSVEAVGDLLEEANRDRGLHLPAPFRIQDVMAAFQPGWIADPGALDRAMAAASGIPDRSREPAIASLARLRKVVARASHPFTFLDLCAFEGLRKACLKLPPGPGRDLGEWLSAASAPCHGLTAQGLLVHALLPAVRARVRELKNAGGLYDHEDTILQVKAALDGPAGAELGRRIGENYQVALIDEFQDTDQAQWEIFHQLFGGDGKRLYVIGDPKQAIYGFRGGDLPTYVQAVRSLLGDAAPLELEANFRSTPGMIEACNALFTGGTKAEAFFQDPAVYPAERAVRCGNPDLDATTADGRPLAPVKILITRRLKGGQDTWRTLADALAQAIRDTVAGDGVVLHDPGARRPEQRARRLHYGDVQVLVGTGKEGRLMAKALARIGVPSTSFKQKGLFQSEEARDLLDVLRAIERPMDPGRRARALLTPFFGYRLPDLDRLGALPDDHPAIRRLVQWGKLGEERRFPLMLEAMLSGSGLALRLRLRTGSERALTNYLHLAEILADSGRHGAADLQGLVRLLDLWVAGRELPAGEDTELQRVEGQDRTVQILTLHASKGLEAGIVALFAFSPGRKPSLHRFHTGAGERAYTIGSKHGPYEDRIQEEEASEQERLMYVGLTRAKAQLILPCFLVETKAGKPSHPLSAYKVVNRRLRPVAEQPGFRPDLFERIEPAIPERRARETGGADLSGWRMPALPRPAPVDYEAARRQARPTFTTSYTHLERILKRTARAETALAEPEPDAPDAPASGEALPRGSETGLAVHEILAEEDCALAMALEFPAWWEDPARRKAVRASLDAHGLEARWDEKAARMVHAALRAPLPDRDGGAAPLGVHQQLLRETAFLARFEDTGDFLEGYLDAVYLRDGRTYLLDWKTNAVAPYSPARLEAFFEEHFAIQAKIYTLVLLDHLNLDDEASYERGFGGIHYVFLRATPPALHSFRPSWTMIQAWRRDLLELHTKVAHA